MYYTYIDMYSVRQNNNRVYCFLIQMHLLNRETENTVLYKRKERWNSKFTFDIHTEVIFVCLQKRMAQCVEYSKNNNKHKKKEKFRITIIHKYECIA